MNSMIKYEYRFNWSIVTNNDRGNCMFQNEIEELYNFQSKEELVRKFSVIKQDRKTVV